MIDLPQDFDATQLTDAERAVLEEYARRKAQRKKSQSLPEFVQESYPGFVFDEVHLLIMEKLEKVARHEIDRLMIFVAPRTGKSLITSVLFPAYYIGHRPDHSIMQASHSTNLAENFGRDCRNILLTETYQEMFPETRLSKDSRATASWATTRNGKYTAVGVGTNIAGRGWMLGLCDDLQSEQTAMSKAQKDATEAWYGPGFYTRRFPNMNALVLIMTRWATDDIAGRLLAKQVVDQEADKWDVVSIPAILDEESAKELTRISHTPEYRKYLACDQFPEPITFKAGDSFSPRRWPKKELLRSKNNMTAKSWAALYMQSPVTDGGEILKREHWKPWPKNKALPKFEYIYQFYDTAFEPEEVNDYSARTTWGVFRREEDGLYCCMVLERWKARVEFPELRTSARESFKEYHPDRILIEKKASGHSLVQELRRLGLPVKGLTIKGSKTMRAHAASILLEQGVVYYPEGKQWAEDLIESCAVFPNGPNDDDVDTCTLSWNYLRRMFLLETPVDNPDEEDDDHFDSTPVRSYARRHGNYARST